MRGGWAGVAGLGGGGGGRWPQRPQAPTPRNTTTPSTQSHWERPLPADPLAILFFMPKPALSHEIICGLVPGVKAILAAAGLRAAGGGLPGGAAGGSVGPDTRSVFCPGTLREISRVPRGAEREPAGIPGEVSRCPGGLARDCPAGIFVRRRPVAAPSHPTAVPGPGKIGARGKIYAGAGGADASGQGAAMAGPKGQCPGGPGRPGGRRGCG
jgi:hypothetical protein